MEEINVNWTEKTDLVNDILAEDFNNAFKSIQDGFDDTTTEINEIKENGGGITEERVNEIINEKIGDIDTALDNIIAIQTESVGD